MVCGGCGAEVDSGELSEDGLCAGCAEEGEGGGGDPLAVELELLRASTSDALVLSIGAGVLRAQRALGLL